MDHAPFKCLGRCRTMWLTFCTHSRVMLGCQLTVVHRTRQLPTIKATCTQVEGRRIQRQSRPEYLSRQLTARPFRTKSHSQGTTLPLSSGGLSLRRGYSRLIESISISDFHSALSSRHVYILTRHRRLGRLLTRTVGMTMNQIFYNIMNAMFVKSHIQLDELVANCPRARLRQKSTCSGR